MYFALATRYSGVQVDWAFIAFVPFIVLGGALIDLGISLAVATVSFWFVRVDTLRWVIMSLEQEFTRYPISIYTRGVRIILSFVFPFAFMNYFPATFLLHKAETGLSLSPQIGLLTPLIGAGWLAVSYAFWRIGLQHYQGTGS
jgi:ABC-2 type transport system permease protein